MEYIDFLEQVKEQLSPYLGPLYYDSTISITEVDRGGGSYWGIQVVPMGENMGVSMNLSEAYEMYQNRMPMNEVMNAISDHILDGIENRPLEFGNFLKSYDDWKKHLLVEAIPVKENEERLRNCPHKIFSDIAVTYRIAMESNDGLSSVRVTNDMIEKYHVSPNQLHKDAMTYAPEMFPAELKSMTSVLSEMMGIPEDEMKSMEMPGIEMHVLCSRQSVFGAGVLFYPGQMDEIAKQMGGDFIILPSSVDEVLILKDNGELSYEAAKQMVQSVNRDEVPLDKQLGTEAYHYDAKGKVFEKALEFEARMKHPERESMKEKLEALNEKRPLLHERGKENLEMSR